MRGFLSHAVLILTAVVFGGFLLSCNVENDNPSVPTMPDDVPTPEPEPQDETVALTFEAAEAGAVVRFLHSSTSAAPEHVEVSTDGGSTWTALTSDGVTLAHVGDKVSFRGRNAAYGSEADGWYSFDLSRRCYVYGNIMSLIDKEHYATLKNLSADYTFSNLFKDQSNLLTKDDKKLLLPAETLTGHCYYYMFQGCSSLTVAPELPATELTESCYCGMFYICSNLTVAPELPAMELKESCYDEMFYGCQKLAAAPALPAMSLADKCYAHMFEYCLAFVEAPELPATELKKGCYQCMFKSCFNLTVAPVLHAKTLVKKCYWGIFEDCQSLASVTCLALSKQATEENELTFWLYGAGSEVPAGTNKTLYTSSSSTIDWDTDKEGFTVRCTDLG